MKQAPGSDIRDVQIDNYVSDTRVNVECTHSKAACWAHVVHACSQLTSPCSLTRQHTSTPTIRFVVIAMAERTGQWRAFAILLQCLAASYACART
eukprot:5137027-Amphidinium_carterae.1